MPPHTSSPPWDPSLEEWGWSERWCCVWISFPTGSQRNSCLSLLLRPDCHLAPGPSVWLHYCSSWWPQKTPASTGCPSVKSLTLKKTVSSTCKPRKCWWIALCESDLHPQPWSQSFLTNCPSWLPVSAICCFSLVTTSLLTHRLSVLKFILQFSLKLQGYP